MMTVKIQLGKFLEFLEDKKNYRARLPLDLLALTSSGR